MAGFPGADRAHAAEHLVYPLLVATQKSWNIHDHEGEPAAPQQFLNFLPLRHGQ